MIHVLKYDNEQYTVEEIHHIYKHIASCLNKTDKLIAVPKDFELIQYQDVDTDTPDKEIIW